MVRIPYCILVFIMGTKFINSILVEANTLTGIGNVETSFNSITGEFSGALSTLCDSSKMAGVTSCTYTSLGCSCA